MTFEEMSQGLLRGDFTALDPLFLDGSINRWLEAGLFDSNHELLNEALSCACFNGHTLLARKLIEKGADPALGNKTGLNAFHWAAERGQVQVVQMLIQQHAPLESINSYGGTVLSCTVWSALQKLKPGHLQVIKTLLDAGADRAQVRLPTGNNQIDALFENSQN
jgi:ankyrin repeat protein